MPTTTLIAFVLSLTLSGVPGEQVQNPTPPDLKPGSSGATVLELQNHLEAAGFFPGRKDGYFGRRTRAAVYAFQKLYDLERTGTFQTEDWELLGRHIGGPGPGPEPDRVEIDLRRQILYLIEGETVTGVFPISTGNGEVYRNARGSLVNAETPEGRFELRRSREGWWESYLGFLYSPMYFYGGYAIHGSGSVPPFPASHGCVRVEVEDMDFLRTRLALGMPVYLYGDELSRSDLIPDLPEVLPARSRPWS